MNSQVAHSLQHHKGHEETGDYPMNPHCFQSQLMGEMGEAPPAPSSHPWNTWLKCGLCVKGQGSQFSHCVCYIFCFYQGNFWLINVFYIKLLSKRLIFAFCSNHLFTHFLCLFYFLTFYFILQYKKAWQPTPVFLPGESHGQRSLVSCILSMGSQRIRHNWSDLACVHSQLCRRTWHPVCWPGKSHGQRGLVGYSLWGHKWVGHNLSTKQHIAN